MIYRDQAGTPAARMREHVNCKLMLPVCCYWPGVPAFDFEMSKHKCPPWCHRCPDMGGDVMPMCWGTIHDDDLERCTCNRPSRRRTTLVTTLKLGDRIYIDGPAMIEVRQAKEGSVRLAIEAEKDVPIRLPDRAKRLDRKGGKGLS
jgi:hypothetical protein